MKNNFEAFKEYSKYIEKYEKYQNKVARNTYYLFDEYDEKCILAGTKEIAIAYFNAGGIVRNGLEERVDFNSKPYKVWMLIRIDKHLHQYEEYTRARSPEIVEQKFRNIFDRDGMFIEHIHITEISEEEFEFHADDAMR